MASIFFPFPSPFRYKSPHPFLPSLQGDEMGIFVHDGPQFYFLVLFKTYALLGLSLDKFLHLWN